MFFTYIMASGRNGTLYIGHTDNLRNRVEQHQTKAFTGFTAKYDVTDLVWFRAFESREAAFARERAMKQWRRAWKVAEIERHNPGWRCLALTLEAFAEQVPDPTDFAFFDPPLKKPGSSPSRG